MAWSSYDGGETLGQTGSEGGVILRDEEHEDGARITLEEGGTTAPFAITCGIYGWMFHTTWCGTRQDADARFEQMREGIGVIVDQIPRVDDPESDAKCRVVTECIVQFVDRFP